MSINSDLKYEYLVEYEKYKVLIYNEKGLTEALKFDKFVEDLMTGKANLFGDGGTVFKGP